MNGSKTTYWEIYVKNKWHGRFANNEAKLAALKKLTQKRINPRHIQIKLCYGYLGKI